MKLVRDPNGAVMKLHLLQIMERDEQGPLMLRCRRDHERISMIPGVDEAPVAFWTVWAPENDVLGELRLSDIKHELDATRRELGKYESTITEAKQRIESQDGELARLRSDNATKTEALRELQKQVNPEREAFRVAEAVKTQTASLEDGIRARNKTIADLERENEELRASKRKLKEANERLKEGRK